jgi:hypothetical protein
VVKNSTAIYTVGLAVQLYGSLPKPALDKNSSGEPISSLQLFDIKLWKRNSTQTV